MVRSIFVQPSAEEVWAQHGRVVEQLDPDIAWESLVDAKKSTVIE
jgi:hypothetical protein